MDTYRWGCHRECYVTAQGCQRIQHCCCGLFVNLCNYICYMYVSAGFCEPPCNHCCDFCTTCKCSTGNAVIIVNIQGQRFSNRPHHGGRKRRQTNPQKAPIVCTVLRRFLPSFCPSSQENARWRKRVCSHLHHPRLRVLRAARPSVAGSL